MHSEFLAKQQLPPACVTKHIWDERFQDIRSFERYLHRNGTIVRKFFLHVSKEEQKLRFLKRIEEKEKNWKFSTADIAERALWGKYQAAYQEVIRHTATKSAPWLVVPADHKWFARVVISSVIVSAMEKLDLRLEPRAMQGAQQVRREHERPLEHRDNEEVLWFCGGDLARERFCSLGDCPLVV